MPVKTYVTNTPNKSGAFMVASRIVSSHGGNITRVSYNKAVDLHTLFIDVDACDEAHAAILKELTEVGYIVNGIPELRMLVIEILIPDCAGALLPVLKILDRYDINISYMNSRSDNSPYQRFAMGLLIEKPGIVQRLLEEISELYRINILDYDSSGTNLDNTVFYIRLATEMQRLLSLSSEKTMEFLSETNRILQMHQEKGDSPDRVFAYVRRFAAFVSQHRGAAFAADVQTMSIGSCTLYSIQPPCGSNTYLLQRDNEVAMFDTGYAIYEDEMRHIFHELLPNWDTMTKNIYITHADVDHCGLLAKMPGIPVYLGAKSAESLRHQRLGVPDFREANSFCMGYSRLSRIISGYLPPDSHDMVVLDENTPPEHNELLLVACITVCGLPFEVYEGSGGHIYGETIFLCRSHGLVFTGDNLVNISGFSAERAEFNALAPYLMGSVNIDSKKATKMRKDIIKLIAKVDEERKEPCIICGGHGPLSVLKDGKLVNLEPTERSILHGQA